MQVEEVDLGGLWLDTCYHGLICFLVQDAVARHHEL
jgi:hypothetical protein